MERGVGVRYRWGVNKQQGTMPTHTPKDRGKDVLVRNREGHAG